MYQYGVSRPSAAEQQQPDGDETHARTRPCGGRRSARVMRGVSGATMIMIGAIGRSRSAVDERAVAEDELEVLRDEEHHAVHGQEHEDHAAGAGAERRVPEVADVEHRLVGAQLPEARSAVSTTTAMAKARERGRRSPSPSSGASIRP